MRRDSIKQEAVRTAGSDGPVVIILVIHMAVEDSVVFYPLYTLCISMPDPQLPFSVYHFIVLYADDILMMAPYVTELQRPLTLHETELG